MSSSLLRGMANAIKPLVVFVLGGPGAGKGTQCARIVKVRDLLTRDVFVLLLCVHSCTFHH